MAPTQTESNLQENGELEFFGAKLKVKNPHLAALLNSSVHEDVQVIGARVRGAFAGAYADRAEHAVEQRILHADDSVHLCLEEVEGV